MSRETAACFSLAGAASFPAADGGGAAPFDPRSRSLQEPTQLDGKHQKLADKLAKLQGADFDRQYMEAMVDGHKKVVKETKRVADTGMAGTSGHSGEAPGSTAATPPGSAGTTGTSGATATSAEEQAVTQFASKTLPIVQQHLEHAQTIEQSIGKKTK